MTETILIVALLGFAAASLYLGYRIRLDEFASYRSRATFSHIVFSLLSSLVGGWMFFGLSAIGYEAGVVGYIIGVAYAIGLVILGWQAPRIKKIMTRNNYDTLDEFVGGRFGRTAQTVTSTVNVVFFLTVLAAQFVAMTALLTIFIGGQEYLIFGLAAIVVIAYTAAAGFKGVLLTDVWQFVIVAGAIILSFSVAVAGVGVEAVETLPSSYFSGTAYGTVFIVAVLIFFPPSLLVRTDLWQRIASAETSEIVQKAFYWTAPVLLLFYFLLTSLGMFARVHLPELANHDQSGLRLVLSIVGGPESVNMNPGIESLLALFAVGILAALISTIDTNLNVISVALSKLGRRTEWEKYEERQTGSGTVVVGVERELLRDTRVITVILGIAGASLAIALPDIVELIVSAGAIILIFLPSVLGALVFDHSDRVAASSSIIAGFVTFIIALLTLGEATAAFAPGVLIAIVVYGGVRVVRK